MTTSTEAISMIGARLIEYVHKTSEGDAYWNAYATGIARGLAESIVAIVMGRNATIRPEYAEAVMEWARGQRDVGQLALSPAEVRSLRRALSVAVGRNNTRHQHPRRDP